jgi:flavin reductase (DIM6/NTAB) family NADH-FMN oxidoreductase RutF
MLQITPKEALSKRFPLPCAFIISVDAQKKPSGMAASWVTQISSEPLLVAVSISKARYTYNLVKDSKEFVVAVPNKKLAKEIEFFGTNSGRDIDKFKTSKLRTMKSKYIKPPLLLDASVNYECKLVNIVDAGAYSIFIGEVINAYINSKEKILMYMGKVKEKRIFKEF